ncbi:MAG: hypothetical protein FD129_1259 [bacterium]|nr:MAG: hypothetical protein FD129_1259 [bacterium]
MIPMKRAKRRLPIDSLKATLAPARTRRFPSGTEAASRSTSASACCCEWPGATLAVSVMARSRSRRVMACNAGRSSVATTDDSGTSCPEPVRTRSLAMSSGRER